MIYFGSVCEIIAGKSLVRVDYMGVKTDFIPYAQVANSLKRSLTQPQIGEQVLLIIAQGGAAVALGSIFSNKCNEPSGAALNTDITEYKDGSRLEYDADSGVLKISGQNELKIITNQAVNITTQEATVTAPNITLNGNTSINGNIATQGGGGGGGSFKIKGEVSIEGSLGVSGDISSSANVTASGNISAGASVHDGRGSLSEHTNNGYARD